MTYARFNEPVPTDDPPIGDGFLLKRGLTVAAIVWEFDVAPVAVARAAAHWDLFMSSAASTH